MGIVLSTLHLESGNKLKSLETIDAKIKKIEEYTEVTEERFKFIVARLVVVSIVLYLTAAVIFYNYFLPTTLVDTMVFGLPLFLFPIAVFYMKRTISWYYNRKLTNNGKMLLKLRDQKCKLLEEIMNKETYTVARNILERFADRPSLPASNPYTNPQANLRWRNAAQSLKNKSLPAPSSSGYERPITQSVASGMVATANESGTPSVTGDKDQDQVTPTASSTSIEAVLSVPTKPYIPTAMQCNASSSSAMPKRLVRPVISAKESWLERMIHYIVGEGPNHRYAMICVACQNHNGMALREEFEYLGFKCVFCKAYNPARKLRSHAPTLMYKERQSPKYSNATVMPQKQVKSDSERT